MTHINNPQRVRSTQCVGIRQRLASLAVQSYFIHAPFAAGKYALWRFAAERFLVAAKDGLWLRVSGASSFEWSVFLRDFKEERTESTFKEFIRPGMVVFDIGANIGYYSLIASSLVGDSGSVHAFEPTPALVSRIRDNAQLNRITNIQANETAVCDVEGTLDFGISDDDSEANSLVSAGDSWEKVRVRCTTLDNYVAQNRIRRVDVIKIDCEGAELRVLQGGSMLLGDDKPPVIFIELNTETLEAAHTSAEAVLSFLEGFGYRCYELECLRSGALPVKNVLAVPSNFGAELPKLPVLTAYRDGRHLS